MKIIVTGGAGFIGSHVSRSLLLEGHDVTIVDSLNPYYSIERKKAQLAHIKEVGSFQFHHFDLRDERKTNELFQHLQPDAVIHLAALPGVRNSFLSPGEYIDFDIKATVHVLKAAGDTGAKHIIFASSSSVYGNRCKEPLKEEVADGKVISPYAAAKYGAESFCHAYEKLYGYTVSIVRFFTVYGPWGRPDMAIFKFIQKAMKGDPIELYDIHSARDYTYIDDAVCGVLKILDENKSSNIFNIGSGKPIPLMNVVEELKQHFPALKVKESSPQMGDVSWTWADITKAREILGYKPSVSFEEGIRRTVEWAKTYVQTD